MKEPKSIADQFRELQELRIRVRRAELAAAKTDDEAPRKDDGSRPGKSDIPRRGIDTSAAATKVRFRTSQ